DGPIKENVFQDSDVDLTKLPWPKWHERDGGPYICATSSVTRDLESGYINVGSYRFMLLGKNKIVAHIGSGHHGDVIRKKYWAKGKPCPIAICLGQEPSLLVAAGTNTNWGVSEYGFAGWMRGAPVEVTQGVFTDLPIPATAEVVLEGGILPPSAGCVSAGSWEVTQGVFTVWQIPATAEVVLEGEMLPPSAGLEIEGPFGEFSGYYGGGARPAPVTMIRSMLYRNEPIILGSPPFIGARRGILSSRGILVWHGLDDLGLPDIK